MLIVDDRGDPAAQRRHRGVARRTDVLAFPLETPGAPSPLVGQIVISAETARRQARRLDVALATELDLSSRMACSIWSATTTAIPVEAA